MSGPVLLDTCVIRHFFGKTAKERTPNLVRRVEEVLGEQGPHISIVTMYEIDRWLQRLQLMQQGASKARVFNLFFSTAIVYEMNETVWRLAARIHANAALRNITFSEADLLILSTACVHNRRLVTTDLPFAQNTIAFGLAERVEALTMS